LKRTPPDFSSGKSCTASFGEPQLASHEFECGGSGKTLPPYLLKPVFTAFSGEPECAE
jgi:hypothetical protein